MTGERPRLHTAIEQVLQPVTGELTLEALHVRVQESLGFALLPTALHTALEALVAGNAVAETAVGQRRSYRWLGWNRAPLQGAPPPTPPPAAPAPQPEPPMAKAEKPKRKMGEARERIRAIWDQDRKQTAEAIAAKVDMTAAAVGYHLGILRKEAKGEGTVAAFARHKRAKAEPRTKATKRTEAPLDAELQRISARFAPIVHLPEKIAVLDQLASGINGKVGALLVEIREDLVRVGA